MNLGTLFREFSGRSRSGRQSGSNVRFGKDVLMTTGNSPARSGTGLPSHDRRRRRRHRIRKTVVWLSWGNLGLLLALVILLRYVSEHWWFTTALVYLPRTPYLLVPLVLLPLAILYSRRAIIANSLSLVLVFWPIMGLAIPWPSWGARNEVNHLRIVSCNVHGYQPAFEGLMSEVTSAVPDVVVFQEAFREHPLLEKEFSDWFRLHVGEYFVASRRHEVRHVATFKSEGYHRVAAVMFEIADAHPYRLVNIHQTSPRGGLIALSASNVLDGTGAETVERSVERRKEEAAALRRFVEEHRGELPLLIVGDFNMPSDSSLYRASWGDFRNAFDASAFGYGYTASCGKNRFWPDGTPWCRVDHILASREWHAQNCWVGGGNGSDHRMIAAILE